MEDKHFSYEGMLARMERSNRRLIVVLIIALAFLFLSNIAWLYCWMQYDYTSESVEIDSHEGTANYIGRDGDITNGES